MKQKKIMLLTDCLVDPDAGGAERKIYQLAEHLAKNDYDVILASLDCEGSAPDGLVERIGCRLEIFRVKRIYGISGFIQGRRFQRFLENEKVDILMTYHFSSDIWGSFYARKAKVPGIVSNRRDMGFWRKPWHVWAYRWINSSVQKIVTVSRAVKKEIIKTENVSEDKIEVIYNGVEVSEKVISTRESLVKELGLNDKDVVIMHVANFKPVKGHAFLLEAISRLVKNYSNIKVLLVGEDEFDGALETQAADLSIADKVVFLGKRNDVRDLLKVSDICVMPSLSEGMSNAVLEYMEAGKPTVATRVGGNPETVEDGKTGFLVEPKDVVALEKALEKLILDSEVRQQMGDAAKQKMEETFSIEKMYQRYQSLFKSLAGST